LLTDKKIPCCEVEAVREEYNLDRSVVYIFYRQIDVSINETLGFQEMILTTHLTVRMNV